MKDILGIILIFIAIGLIILAIRISELIISGLLILAAIDLFSTVLKNKPIIKAGPLARLLYNIKN